MKKRVLLAFVAMLTMMGAKAQSPYGLTICGVPVTDDNKADLIAAISGRSGIEITGTGTMSYDSETQTLLLNNVNISYNYSIISSNSSTNDLTIEQSGTNILQSSAGNIIINDNSYSSTTIKGDGSLTLKQTGGNQAAIRISGYARTLTFDHTTVDIQDNYGLIPANLHTLRIIESTIKVYQVKSFRNIILNNSSIQSPEGAFIDYDGVSMMGGAIKVGDEYATNIVIVPDTRADTGLKWEAADDWDSDIKSWWESYGRKRLTFEYPRKVSPAKLTNPHNVAVTYTSSIPEKIQIDATTGVVTVIKPGAAKMTASFAGNTEYQPTIVSYNYIVNKGNPKFSFAESSYKAMLGKDFTEPTPTIKNCLGEEVTGYDLLYESSDETVATISATGKITPLKKGETTIKVWLAENDFYTGGNSGHNYYYGKYTLTVVDPGTTTLEFPEEEYRVAANGSFTAPTLKNLDNVPVTYSSSDETVAEVDATTGAVTIKKAGETTITATFAGNDDFLATSASYKLIVQKIYAAIAFPKLEYTYVISTSPFDAPTVQTTPEGLSVTYSSSNQTVAKVNATTGAVEILKPGETTIMATFAGNDIYNEVSGSYKLIVSFVKGDADGDGAIDVNDVTTTINHILGKPVANFVYEAANIDGDDTIDVNDVQGIIDRALGKVTE